MINLKKYIISVIYKRKNKKIDLKNYDSSFWGIIYENDLEKEEEDKNVRYCFTIYEPIN